MLKIILIFLLLMVVGASAQVPPSPGGRGVLDWARQLSSQGASADSPEDAKTLASAALEGGVPGAALGVPPASLGSPPPQALETRSSPRGKVPLSVRRAQIRKGRALGRIVRKVGMGLLGFLGGLVLGSLLGAAAVAWFLITAPNPKLRVLKWFLLLPGILLGAVAGQVAMPWIGAWFMSQTEPYEGVKKP